MLDLVRNRVYVLHIVYKARLKVLDGCCDGLSAVAPDPIDPLKMQAVGVQPA
jgi:hypothetical protein